MQLIVEIKNETLLDKIIQILNIFKGDGVEVIFPDNPQETKQLATTQSDLRNDDFEAVEKSTEDWYKDLMTNEDPNISDDEVLPQAYWEYTSAKYTDR